MQAWILKRQHTPIKVNSLFYFKYYNSIIARIGPRLKSVDSDADQNLANVQEWSFGFNILGQIYL